MRVTNAMIAANITRGIHQNLYMAGKLHEQISSGNRVHRPSDDPVSLSKIMKLRSQSTKSDRYINSINSQIERLKRADAAFDWATKIMIRVKEIAIQGSNSSINAGDAGILREEVDNLIDEMILAGSASRGDMEADILFDDNEDPSTVKYEGDTVHLYKDLDSNDPIFKYFKDSIFNPGLLNDVVDPNEVFRKTEGSTSAPNDLDDGSVFDTLLELRNALSTGDTSGVQTVIEDIDKNLDRLLKYRAGLGAKSKRLESLKMQLEEQKYTIEENLADVQSVDIAKAVVDLSQVELTYRAALEVGARILQTGLVDYLW